MTLVSTKSEQLLELVRSRGLVRVRDLAEHRIPAAYLGRLHERGLLERVSRGLYALPNAATSEHGGLAQVVRRVPRGVVCLLSALRFHGLTTQAPSEVWLAIPARARKPTIDYPPVRIFRFTDEALREGVSEHVVDGVAVRVTGPARTVADCFKFRNKIGLDVALEALKDCLARHAATPDELYKAAVSRGVAGVIRPYLEASA